MIFSQKLDLLMNITSTTNSALAHAISLDSSFISRLRRGIRHPAKKENYLQAMAAYFARHCTAGYQKAALGEALKMDTKNWSADGEKTAELIYKWFLEKEMGEKQPVEKFLEGLTQFSFSKAAPINAVDAFSNTESIGETTVLYGVEGKQKAVIAFLSLVLQHKSPQTLLLYSDEDLGWLTENRAFAAQWAALLLQIIMAGNKIKIVHTINRNLDEMLSAIEEWLPIYMTGAIEPYYYPKTRDGVFRRSLFIAPATAAVNSTSVGNGPKNNEANFLFTDRKTIQALTEEYNDYLALCRPLMRIFTPDSRKGYLVTLTEFENEEAASVLKTDSLSMLTMPTDVAESICLRLDNETARDQLLSYQHMRVRGLENILQEHEFTEIVAMPDLETIQNGRVRVGFSDMLGDIELFYRPEEFKAHLQNTIRLLKTFDNYYLYPVSSQEMTGYMLYVKEDVGVLVAKTVLPSVIFAMNESNMTAAFWDFMRVLTNKAVKDGTNREKIMAKLTAMMEQI